MNACEYLAQVGFDALLESSTSLDDDKMFEPAAIELARLADHRQVRERLLSRKPEPLVGRHGVCWIRKITWPDRVPGLKTWAGNMTLAKTIISLQKAVKASAAVDLFELRSKLKGASGIDDRSCQNAIDIGFSPAAIDMPIVQRPALELLAIVGLETLPLISLRSRECGFIHASMAWKFRIDKRDGGYLYRWGKVEVLNTIDHTPIRVYT